MYWERADVGGQRTADSDNRMSGYRNIGAYGRLITNSYKVMVIFWAEMSVNITVDSY